MKQRHNKVFNMGTTIKNCRSKLSAQNSRLKLAALSSCATVWVEDADIFVEPNSNLYERKVNEAPYSYREKFSIFAVTI